MKHRKYITYYRLRQDPNTNEFIFESIERVNKPALFFETKIEAINEWIRAREVRREDIQNEIDNLKAFKRLYENG